MPSPLYTRRRKEVLAFLLKQGPSTQFEIMAGTGEPHDPGNRSLYVSFWESLKLLVARGLLAKETLPSLNQILYSITSLGQEKLAKLTDRRLPTSSKPDQSRIRQVNQGIIECPNCRNKLKITIPGSPEEIAALSDEITRGETGEEYRCAGCQRDLSDLVQVFLEDL